MAGIGSHQSAARGTDDWVTPIEVIRALGHFDLDPCACIPQPWPTADRMLTVNDNGLIADWVGRAWVNPPYGLAAAKWLGRLAAHGDGIALVFARTETAMFFEYVWPKCSGMLFIEGRLHFHYPDGRDPQRCVSGGEHVWKSRLENDSAMWCWNCGKAKTNSGGPSVLVAYGAENAERLKTCGIAGAFVDRSSFVLRH